MVKQTPSWICSNFSFVKVLFLLKKKLFSLSRDHYYHLLCPHFEFRTNMIDDDNFAPPWFSISWHSVRLSPSSWPTSPSPTCSRLLRDASPPHPRLGGSSNPVARRWPLHHRTTHLVMIFTSNWEDEQRSNHWFVNLYDLDADRPFPRCFNWFL